MTERTEPGSPALRAGGGRRGRQRPLHRACARNGRARGEGRGGCGRGRGRHRPGGFDLVVTGALALKAGLGPALARSSRPVVVAEVPGAPAPAPMPEGLRVFRLPPPLDADALLAAAARGRRGPPRGGRGGQPSGAIQGAPGVRGEAHPVLPGRVPRPARSPGPGGGRQILRAGGRRGPQPGQHGPGHGLGASGRAGPDPGDRGPGEPGRGPRRPAGRARCRPGPSGGLRPCRPPEENGQS